jgi:YidC/Oxa1 family membrane protein insertase
MLLFVALSAGVLFGSQFLMEHYFPAQKARPSAAAAVAPGQGATGGVSPVSVVAPTAKPAVAEPSTLKASPEKLVTVETGSYEATLSSWGGRFTSLKLKGLTAKVKDQVQTLDLITSADSPRYGVLDLPGTDLAGLQWSLDTPVALDEAGRKVVRFSTRVPGTALQLVKSFSFDPQGPHFDVKVLVKNLGGQPLSLQPLAFVWGPDLGGDEGVSSRRMVPPAVVVQLDGRIEREKADNDVQTLGYSAPKWMAVKNHYFVAGFFPSQGFNKAEVRRLGSGHIAGALVAEGLTVGAGQAVELAASAYAGPQDYVALKAVGQNFERVVQFEAYRLFDWLNPVSVGLLYVLRWFHGISGNWGVAIILLTLLVRALMFWPSLKSMVAMRRMQSKMAAMKPRLDTIKKMYKDDAQKLNSETMKLYQEHGVNPLGGCLPMLLQIPIFFALYGTLNAAFELRGAPFMWKWADLTAGDPTYIFPLAMGASMFFQQKLAPTNSATMSDDQAQIQKMMLWLMPIMFTFMALSMHWPMGLLLYWTASNLFGIGQQLAVNKAVD